MVPPHARYSRELIASRRGRGGTAGVRERARATAPRELERVTVLTFPSPSRTRHRQDATCTLDCAYVTGLGRGPLRASDACRDTVTPTNILLNTLSNLECHLRAVLSSLGRIGQMGSVEGFVIQYLACRVCLWEFVVAAGGLRPPDEAGDGRGVAEGNTWMLLLLLLLLLHTQAWRMTSDPPCGSCNYRCDFFVL